MQRTMQPYDADKVQEMLAPLPLVSSVHVYNSLSSTNETLRRLARNGAPSGTLVLADRQTGGRGRLGRSWHSPPGVGLWFSFLLRPAGQENGWALLPMVLSEVIVTTLRRLFDLPFAVKWPNDVLFEGRKLCGILCESSSSGEAVETIIAGIGININQQEGDFPEDLRRRAVSLRQITGGHIDRSELLQNLMTAISRRLEPVISGGQHLHLQRWHAYCPDFGKKVHIHAGNRRIAGIFRQVSGLGEIIIEQEHGELAVVSCGEATFHQR